MIFSHKNMLRCWKRGSSFTTLSQFKLLIVVLSLLLLPGSSLGQFFQNSNPAPYRIGFERNSSVYRWGNGYREEMVPTFNTSREARRSVVSGGLFSIVSFDNVPCNSDSGEVGTCYSNRECTNMGGTSSGICAGSYGTCCVLRQTCGSTISTNNTYFVNPDYPGTTSGPLSCTITVQPLAGATQLYLEFLDFNIRGPSSGQCMNDTFTAGGVAGATTGFPTICGINTGQAVYLPISVSTTLSFNLGSDSLGRQSDLGRSWKIRLVQFFAGNACFAPPGCTEFYRDPTGMFESFNYANGMGEMINNYCYNACFLVQSPNCGVVLTEGQFMLPGIAPSDCSEGYYILIGDTKYCGDTLNNGMIMLNSTMGYAKVQVCSGMSNPDMDVGFSLNYSPIPCSMTSG